jgi:XTP/dITP diphosphohydrolase
MDVAFVVRDWRLIFGAALSGEIQVKPDRPLLLATHNKGKLRELRQLLDKLPFDAKGLDDFPALQPVPESGKTFAENAALKAVGYARQARLLSLADDSGLEVDALSGAPGVLSARYAGDASDAERTNKLLGELLHVPDEARTAQFVSAVAIANESAEVIYLSQEVCRGRISRSARGTGGFGYDPIFIPDGFNQTLAELAPEIKNQISHRARAVAQAYDFLRSLTDDPGAG